MIEERDPSAAKLARTLALKLAEDERVRLVYLFGSAAGPRPEVARDLDIAFLAVPPLAPDEEEELRAALTRAAGRRVDLVPLDRASVVLGREVADSGRCLFAREPDDEVSFVTRARARYWDFLPFLEVQWEHARERWRERSDGAQA